MTCNKFSLTALFLLVVFLAGCRGEYFAEKEFYKASKILSEISKNPQTSTQAYNAAIDAFEQVNEKHPGTAKAVQSLFIIADLKSKQQNYRGAREALKVIVQNSTGMGGAKAAEARYRIGQLYEAEGDWSSAEKAYWETAEYNPYQTYGLYAPVYVLLHYKKANDVASEKRTFVKTKEHFESLLKDVGAIQASVGLRHYLALTYLIHEDWEKARDLWLGITKEMPKHPGAPLALIAAADVLTEKNDVAKGIGLYRQYLRQYPKHTLRGKILVRLGILEERRGGHDRARAWFEKAMEYYKDKKTAQAELKLFIANTYDKQGFWPQAEAGYREVKRDHPLTMAAMQVPVSLYEHYRKAGNIQKALTYLEEGIRYYQGLSKKYPGTSIDQTARRFLQTAYTKKGDWNQLLAFIDEEIKREQNSVRQGKWLLVKAVIAEKRLQDKDKARALYQDFLSRYPNHPLVRTAEQHQQLLAQN